MKKTILFICGEKMGKIDVTKDEKFQAAAITALNGNEICPFCKMLKPVKNENWVEAGKYINVTPDTDLFICASLDKEGRLYFEANENWTTSSKYYPKFCPNCGRNLQS